jgi:hypothetical protein
MARVGDRMPVRRARMRLRLTARDWRRIWDALAYMREWNETGQINATPPTARDCWLVMRKLGLDGIAASSRGVAPVRKATR